MTIRPSSHRRARRPGFLLMEAVLALAIFGIMAVAFTRTLGGLRTNSVYIQDTMALSQILDSALTEALTTPRIEEGENVVESRELGDRGQLITTIERLELEDEDGAILPNLFSVNVRAVWVENGEERSESLTGWRNAALYRSR